MDASQEPSVYELAAQIRGMEKLYDATDKRYDERDKRYEERFVAQDKAVEKALTAADKLTSAAFASAKEAVTKAETFQDRYNHDHNDLLRKMEAEGKASAEERQRQQELMIPRKEAEAEFKALRTDIQSLRESRSEGTGRKEQTNWLLTLAIGIGSLVLGILSRFIK